jgi:hypothetical protein
MTAADWASQVGCGEAEVAATIEKLEELGLVNRRAVLDLIFYRLTDDKERLRRLDQFIAWRSEWLNRAFRVEQLVGPASKGTVIEDRSPIDGHLNPNTAK